MVNLYKKVLKTAQKMQKGAIFRIFALLDLTTYLLSTYVNFIQKSCITKCLILPPATPRSSYDVNASSYTLPTSCRLYSPTL